MAKEKQGLRRELLSWIKMLATAFILALLINSFIVVNASVPTGSMEETVMSGDRVLCNRLAYMGDNEPQRFDVVVFRFEQTDPPANYLKRIIGLPGEKVEIRDGKVYINDSQEPLDDSFAAEEPYGDYGPFYVPEGHYFMLGDNRNASSDSKAWSDPYISRDKILGKAFFSYYPHPRSIQ